MKKTIKQSPALKQGVIEGYASFFNVTDKQKDQVARGAFRKSLRAWNILKKKPKILWQHDPRFPIGLWTHLFEDQLGLYVKGQLALGVPKADEAYHLLKMGVVDDLSIGFRTHKATCNQNGKGRVLLDIELVEISLVTFGANPHATIHHIKSL